MKCKECNNDLRIEDKKFCYHNICDKCGFETIEWIGDSCCTSPDIEPRKYYKDPQDYFSAPNDYKVYRQCKNCGRKIGTALKKATFPDIETFDFELEKRGIEEKKEIQNLSNEIEERRRTRKTIKYDTEYEEYLKSDQWLKIRSVALERDNFLCQSCLTEQATEVHHTTGHFRFNEPLFSLVSVCSDCHRKITEIERGNNAKEVEKIKYEFDKKTKN